MSSFFGSILTDRSGKFTRQDDFANLENSQVNATYDFEDTYDGLGDQLEETGDDLNDDTFGDTKISRDFDFSGNTARATDNLEGEHLTFQRRQPQPASRDTDRPSPFPAPTESRRSIASDVIHSPWSNSQPTANNNIWGHSNNGGYQVSQSQARQSSHQPQPQPRKFQTLAEVEAAMLASGKQTSVVPTPQQPSYHAAPESVAFNGPPGYQMSQSMPSPISMRNGAGPPGMTMPSHAARNFSHLSSESQPGQAPYNSLPPTAPAMKTSAISTEEEEAIKRVQQQKNLRRAQKIGQMARYNGIMSNGDKNYVLKVQISQLVSEDPEADDFYYTVHSTLRGRNNVQQGLGHYQQTYLSRAGQSNRRGQREKQNPLLKMQQQVQKIIASAKSRPKSTSLAVEGSLGKLSFSRVRQPRQVLNVKMPESSGPLSKQTKKEALQNIENVYSTLLLLEHTGRQIPPESADSELHRAWDEKMSELSEEIWSSLHIMDSVDDSQLHPFIQLLQYAKGKKMIPRLYRNLNPERRLTLITMIVAHLDMLDVVRQARYDDGGNLPREVREDIELFSQTVLPPLLVFASGAPMRIVVGLLNMLLERNHIQLICMSKVGLSFLTMFISRAEIIKQAEQADEAELSAWHALYNRMFGFMEGKFGYIFPPQSHQVDEIYPWQFLAACAVSASPQQQHSLVNEARDRVLDNVQAAKTLPRELADTKRSNVNLFLNAIGLDASQLEA